MSNLATLGGEVAALVARFDRDDDDIGEDATVSRRLEELITAINTTPPESISDALVKLKLLADPGIGIAAGDREDDMISLRQCIAFIEALW